LFAFILTNWASLNSEIVYGPLPVIGNSGSAPMSDTFDQTCSGTIGMSSASIVACGTLVLITRV
jgi:hypothetical protein